MAEYFDDDCPLDRRRLGMCSWMWAHTMAAYYPDYPTHQEQADMKTFIQLFAKFYPCKECSYHFQKAVNTTPPDVSSRTNLSYWWCYIHNLVNKRLGKRIFDCRFTDQRWKYGWDDGSCGR